MKNHILCILGSACFWFGLNVVGLWVDVQGELCYRDILVYGLVEYMDYDIGGLGDLSVLIGIN